jgi:hypothetical protein
MLLWWFAVERNQISHVAHGMVDGCSVFPRSLCIIPLIMNRLFNK